LAFEMETGSGKDDQRVMPICLDLAEFLLKNQRETGYIPSYYRETDLTVDDSMPMNKENAEPAVCALFLTELYTMVGNHKYLDAAEKAVQYVEREIMPQNKWYDFETFYSCSPKNYGYYDQYTGQYPQCNMALLMLTQVCLNLHRIKKNSGYLELGKRMLDYLCLFQQVWSHPRMELNLVGVLPPKTRIANGVIQGNLKPRSSSWITLRKLATRIF